MKNLYFFLLIISGLQLKAQSVEMLPLGTTVGGYYSKSFGIESGETYFSIQSIDTIGGRVCKKITQQEQLGAPMWFAQSGDSIFGCISSTSGWLFMFKNNFTLGEQSNFGAFIGNNEFTVVDIDTLFLDTNPIRRFQINVTTGYNGYSYIYDRLGTESGFLNWCGGACDASAFWICNYESPSIPMVDLPDNVCSLMPIENLQNIDNQSFTVFPNPASDFVQIEFDNNKQNPFVTIIDVFGKTIFTDRMSESPFSLDINRLTPGIYLVKIGNKVQKLIKKD
jgi:Secretion system C-terminal sorting domain